jgi:hypothetical protein
MLKNFSDSRILTYMKWLLLSSSSTFHKSNFRTFFTLYFFFTKPAPAAVKTVALHREHKFNCKQLSLFHKVRLTYYITTMAMGQVFLRVLQSISASIIPPLVHTQSFIHPQTLYNLSKIQLELWSLKLFRGPGSYFLISNFHVRWILIFWFWGFTWCAIFQDVRSSSLTDDIEYSDSSTASAFGLQNQRFCIYLGSIKKKIARCFEIRHKFSAEVYHSEHTTAQLCWPTVTK